MKCTQTLLEQLEWVSIVSKRKPLTFKVHNIILLNYLHSSGGNLWILTFIWMPVDTNCPNTFTDQSHSWRGTGTPWKHWSGQCYTAHNCWCPPGLNMALIRVWVSYGGHWSMDSIWKRVGLTKGICFHREKCLGGFYGLKNIYSRSRACQCHLLSGVSSLWHVACRLLHAWNSKHYFLTPQKCWSNRFSILSSSVISTCFICLCSLNGGPGKIPLY